MTAAPLTREDIAALKSADSITFHYYDGNGFIRAHLQRGMMEPVVFTVKEQRLFPEVDSRTDRHHQINTSTDIYGYSGDGTWKKGDEPKASAFYMDHFVGSNMLTVISLLRAGDTLTLDWVGSNNSENTNAINWHRDELRLVVTRDEKLLTFLIEVQVGPNNSARMVSRHGR